MSRLVFLIGEGSNDIGGLAREPSFQSDDSGFVQPVVRRILRGRIRFEGRQLRVLGKRRVKGLKEAISHKAYFAALLAADRDADLLIFVTDADKGGGANTTSQAARRVDTLRAAIKQGFARAAGDGPDVVTSVVATPCRTIEAWALGDLDAVGTVARLGKPPSIPAPPEQLWGEPHEPTSDHPKSVLRRILNGEPSSSMLSAIAEKAKITTIRVTCPMSFDPFAAALKAFDTCPTSLRR